MERSVRATAGACRHLAHRLFSKALTQPDTYSSVTPQPIAFQFKSDYTSMSNCLVSPAGDITRCTEMPATWTAKKIYWTDILDTFLGRQIRDKSQKHSDTLHPISRMSFEGIVLFLKNVIPDSSDASSFETNLHLLLSIVEVRQQVSILQNRSKI